MRTAGAVLATALVVFMVGVVPVLGLIRYRRYVQRLKTDPGRRARRYALIILNQWTLVGIVAGVGALADRSPASILLRWPDSASALAVLVGLALGAFILVVRLRAGRGQIAASLAKQSRALAILPRTNRERLVFAVVAVTAGVCEEVLYRGFGIAYVRSALHGVSSVVPVLLTAAAFAAAHLYQGRRGVLATLVVGLLLGAITVWSDSLVPAIVYHSLIDLRALLFTPALIAEAERLGALGDRPPSEV